MEGRQRRTIKELRTGRGDNVNDDYAPPYPELEAAELEYHPRIEELPTIQVWTWGGLWGAAVEAARHRTPPRGPSSEWLPPHWREK